MPSLYITYKRLLIVMKTMSVVVENTLSNLPELVCLVLC